MASPASARRADAARNEARLLDAAAALLSREPGAGMAEVAAEAGVGRATLYRHFPSRAKLLEALRDLSHDEAVARFDGARPEEGPADAALARLIGSLLALGDRYAFLITAEREGSLPPKDQARQAELEARGVALVARGQREGTLRDDLPAALLSALLGGALMAGLEEVAAGRSSVQDAAAGVQAVVLDGLRRR